MIFYFAFRKLFISWLIFIILDFVVYIKCKLCTIIVIRNNSFLFLALCFIKHQTNFIFVGVVYKVLLYSTCSKKNLYFANPAKGYFGSCLLSVVS